MLSGRRQERPNPIPLIIGAALAVLVVVMAGGALAATGDEAVRASLLDARGPLIMGVVLGITAFAVTAALGFLRATRRARIAEARASSSAQRLEGELDVLQAILLAEPQTLIYWDQGHTPHIAADTLDPALKVPAEAEGVLDFESWLPPGDAARLRRKLALLREEAAPFNLMLKTKAGAFVEIDGRAKGIGAVMKIRDLAGQRAELSRICSEHERLAQEIGTARAMLDALRVPAWLRDDKGGLEWVNRAYAELVEMGDEEEVLGRQIELFSVRERSQGERIAAKGEVFRGRMEARVGGERRGFDVTLLPLGAASAGIAVPAGEGIERKDAGVPLEAHARTLERIATAVAVFAPDRKLTYFNQAYLDLWQLEREWLAERPGHGQILDRLRGRRLLPEQADYRAWRKRQIEGEGGEAQREDWWHLPDGRSIHMLVDRAQDGSQTFLYEDVTERLTLESRYNSLIQVQKETLDNLQEGVAVFASDGRLKLFNRAFARIWKLEPQALAQQPHIDQLIGQCRVLLDDDAAWDEVKTAVTAIDDERRSISGELARPDGSQLAYASLPLPDGATLLTYVDVTDTKLAEQALIERNEALEAAGRLKSTFISHISYELRVPLTNIIGFSDLLATPAIGPLTERQQDYLADIRASSDTLLAIIDDILDLATIDAGALELHFGTVDVAEVVRAAALGVRDRIQNAKLKLETDMEDAPRSFEADAQRVRQVLYNLLANAVGFSEEGGTITLKVARDGDTVAFTVADRGVGIAPGDQEAVFERFERRAQGSKQRGAGLGLSIAKSLVELHGGDIALQSATGQGTAVTARFPIKRRRAGRDQTPDARSAGGGASAAA